MRTLLLTEIFPPQTGGSGRWFWEIYRRLPREQFVLAVGEHPRQDEFDARHGLDLLRLPLALPHWGTSRPREMWGYGRLARLVHRIVRERGIDRLHCGRVLTEGWVAWLLNRLTGLPYQCYVHGEDVECAATSRELTWMVRRVLARAERLIANSENSARILCESWGVPREKISVLHPGVDTERFRPAPRSYEARRRLGWGDRPVVLTVSRLEPHKGHDMLVRALALVRDAVPDVLYAVVGGGSRREPLRQLVESAGLGDRVRFHGELDDTGIIECYQQCDLFALPGRRVGGAVEGFGMVLLEAQACGRPVVSGTAGGTAETMRVGETGYLVSCEGPEGLAVLVADLLLRPAHLDAMGQAARRWVEDHFDWDALARRAAELFSTGPISPRSAAPTAGTAEAPCRVSGGVNG